MIIVVDESTNLSKSENIDSAYLDWLKLYEENQVVTQEMIKNTIPTWLYIQQFCKGGWNIAKFMDIPSQANVLEIGAGCGGVTQLLSDCVKTVDCIDNSLVKSKINFYRNGKKNNVKIKYFDSYDMLCDNIDKSYDFIVVWGDIEFESITIYNLIPKLIKNVKNGGKLCLCLNNKLGIRYLAGYSDDGKFFDYINQGIEPTDITYKNLTNFFENENIDYQIYYPYPDYENAQKIYSDFRMPSNSELIRAEYVIKGKRLITFDENMVTGHFVESGIYKYISNSYVVVIKVEDNENNYLF